MGFFDKFDKFLEKAEKWVDDNFPDETPKAKTYSRQELLDYYKRNFDSKFGEQLLAEAKKKKDPYKEEPASFRYCDSSCIETSNISELANNNYQIILKGNLFSIDEYGTYAGSFKFSITVKVNNKLEASSTQIVVMR